MNTLVKKLAEEAGFVLWGNEDYNPGDVIDWSSRYDAELERFAKLVARECQQVSLKNSHRDDDMGAIIARQIKKHFGFEE